MKKYLSVLLRFKAQNFVVAFLIVAPLSIQAQLLPPPAPDKPNTFVRYACPDATSSTFIYDLIKAPKSNKVCSSGTQMKVVVVTGFDLGTASVTRLEIESGEHRAQVNVSWNPPIFGHPFLGNVMRVEVWYRKLSYSLLKGCKWSGWTYMYTYDIHRDSIDPLGELKGAITTADAPNSQSESIFNFNYVPTDLNFIYDPQLKIVPLIKATKLRYFNGITNVEVNINKNNYLYVNTPVVFHAQGIGNFNLDVEVLTEPIEGCSNGTSGRWYPLPRKVLSVVLNCYRNDFTGVTITLLGNEAKFHAEDGSYTINLNQNYTLEVPNIPNFLNHFSFVSDGDADVSLNGNTFSVHKDVKSYNITAVANDGCNCPLFLNVLAGGKNTFINENCTITLPEYLARSPYNLPGDDIVLRHFTTNVKSKRSIIVMPGVSLELGAELLIEDEPNVATDDLMLNYKEETGFDEYRRVLSATRIYVDDRGLPVQTQYKNLTSDVVLANATLYDAQGRAAISTLSAPIVAGIPAACPADEDGNPQVDAQTGSSINFSYKPDFVKAANGEIYNATHFDLTNENTPLALEAVTEGTLGWYYSSNNGTSANNKMNEPLVATTNYPYSRTLFKHDGSGEVKGSTKPGDMFKAGSPFLATSETEPVSSDDIYLNEYLAIRERDLGFIQPTVIAGQFIKFTALDMPDADGLRKKAVSYSDKSGKNLISLYYGTSNTPVTKSYSFYDNADRLVAVISPNGLEHYQVVAGVSNFNDVDKTRYFYDGKGRLIALEEKVAGQAADGISRSEYVYRNDGMIRFSQNQEQRSATPQRYSYTNYDRSGRPIESGEYSVLASGIVFNSPAMNAILENKDMDGGLSDAVGSKGERTFTYYDEPDDNLPLSLERVQRFVHGAISYTKKDDVSTTWYSYDEQGRVEWTAQDIKDLGLKTLDYRYGPTGQVQDVVYQKGSATEQFSHYYEYDADSRLKKVYTTRELLNYDIEGKLTNKDIKYYDGKREIETPGILEHQATYIYYLHGPLKRIELAKNAERSSAEILQGIDYTYTIDGSLKSINHANKLEDPGGDGTTTNPNVLPDAFGMTLEYYTNDYASAKDGSESITIPDDFKNQYSGLIKANRWHGPTEEDRQFFYGYEYDQRNQFKKADWGTVTGNLFTISPLKPYHEAIGGYDANGNIASLQRNANVLKPTNYFNYNLTYNYKANTNMLMSITQNQESSSAFRSYAYNDLGQTTEETEGDKSKFMVYDVTGKVTGVYANPQHTEPIVTFVYDDGGFRLSKTSYDANHAELIRTFYVRDASGNVVSTYEQDLVAETEAEPIEIPVYGSGRIGLYKPDYGFTFYELNDQLGNIRAVVADPLEPLTHEYVATMESERDNDEDVDNNPQATIGFYNRKPVTSATFNHTPNEIVIEDENFSFTAPSKVIRINNLPGGVEPQTKEPIGAGIMLWVHPGDVIDADVYARYADFSSSNQAAITNLAPFLSSMFGAAAVIDGIPVFSASNIGDMSALPALTGTAVAERPRAFLNYIIFDKDLNLQIDKNLNQPMYDFKQVPENAEIPLSDPDMGHIEFKDIKIEKEGYIYVYVSNQSNQNVDVYFDDLRVKHTYSNVVAGTDFYPYGLAIKDREITRESYRHGYQGKFAEKDDETGWNHFELRDYDPIIGRWLSKDPVGEFHSPYVGMGNNPVINMDPKGDCIQCWFALQDGFQWFIGLFRGGMEKTIGASQRAAKLKYQQTAKAGEVYEEAMANGDPGSVQQKFENEIVVQQIQMVEGVAEIGVDGTMLYLTLFAPLYSAEGVVVQSTRMGAPLLLEAGTDVGVATAQKGFMTFSELGLTDGMTTSSSTVLDLAEQFLGKGYVETVHGSGRYISADGTRVVRMGVSDITGAHGGGPHLNFETLVPNPAKSGKMMVDQNFHIFITN